MKRTKGKSRSQFYPALISILVIFMMISLPHRAIADHGCLFPTTIEDTSVEGNHIEIPRGQCQWLTLRGKLRHGKIVLSLGENDGTGFFFNEDNGPKSITLEDTSEVMVCSSDSSCGATRIMMQTLNGAIEIGSVRSNHGKWRYVDNACATKGPASYRDGPLYVRISGRHKIEQRYDQSWTHLSFGNNKDKLSRPSCADLGCATKCKTSSLCDAQVGCTECIDLKTYRSLPGEFPCYVKEGHDGNYFYYSIQCACSSSIRHYTYQCQ